MTDFATLTKGLTRELRRPLPGVEAHKPLVPPSQLNDRFKEYDLTKAKKSAVLLLLYPFQNRVNFILIKRVDDGSIHSGQISFPGGKVESTDLSPAMTAIRETSEEIGIPQQNIEILGELTGLYIPTSNFFVYPFVGITHKKPIMKKDDREVADIIEVDLFKLINEKRILGKEISVRGEKIKIRYFNIEGNTVWGATAMILNEFLDVTVRITKQ